MDADLLVLGLTDTAAIVAVVVVAVIVILFRVAGRFLGRLPALWIQAKVSNVHVTMGDLIGMQMRKVDPRTVVLSKIRASKAGIDIPTSRLEAHYLAGGRVVNVVNAMITARGAKIPLSWDLATAIDLAGRDVFEAVQTSVNAKVIECPGPGSPRDVIDAVAADGTPLCVKASVTVRTRLDKLVGGGTEEVLIARVANRIAAIIKSEHDSQRFLDHPEELASAVMEHRPQAGTAFEVLAIEITELYEARRSSRRG